jgi:DNA-directed RNA polymerase subunit M
MMFCKKCGSILLPKKENGKVITKCSCGYVAKGDAPVKMTETLAEKKDVETIENDVEVYPLTNDAECPKCGNEKAYYWEIQTRASDEPATKFMRCEKCRHIWRDYK